MFIIVLIVKCIKGGGGGGQRSAPLPSVCVDEEGVYHFVRCYTGLSTSPLIRPSLYWWDGGREGAVYCIILRRSSLLALLRHPLPEQLSAARATLSK